MPDKHFYAQDEHFRSTPHMMLTLAIGDLFGSVWINKWFLSAAIEKIEKSRTFLHFLVYVTIVVQMKYNTS